MKVVLLLAVLLLMPDGRCEEQKFRFFKSQHTDIADPFKLRDPFKRKNFKRKGKAIARLKQGTNFSNAGEIGKAPLEKVRIVGVLVGPQRRAIAKIVDDSGKVSTESFLVKEGMKLGASNAEVKAILPGGVVVVEKIVNVYDQTEYLETIIPVSE